MKNSKIIYGKILLALRHLKSVQDYYVIKLLFVLFDSVYTRRVTQAAKHGATSYMPYPSKLEYSSCWNSLASIPMKDSLSPNHFSLALHAPRWKMEIRKHSKHRTDA